MERGSNETKQSPTGMCTWIWTIQPEKQQHWIIGSHFGHVFLTYHISALKVNTLPQEEKGSSDLAGDFWQQSRWDVCSRGNGYAAWENQRFPGISLYNYVRAHTHAHLYTHTYSTSHFISLRYIPFYSTPLHCIALHYVALHYIHTMDIHMYIYINTRYIIIYPYYTIIHIFFFGVVATSSFLWFLHSWQVYARLQLRFLEGQKELPQLLHGIFGFYADAWMFYGPVIWRWVKILVPSEPQNSWDKMDVHPTKTGWL